MKKIRLSITVLVAIIATLFTSCDKDVESSSVVLNLDKTGTLKIYFYADLDRTRAGLESPPAGTKVLVKINYSDYKAGVSGAWQDSATIDVNGTISLEVPADDDSVTVRITPMPFEYAQIQPFGTYESTITKIFSANQTDISISSGDVLIRQISYNAPDNYNNFVQKVLLAGNITAEIDDTQGGVDDVEESIDITFHTTEWRQEITTEGDGTFELEVPANTTIYVTSIFQTNNFIGGQNLDYEYELDGPALGSFSASNDNVTVNFGTGIEVE